MTAKKPKPSVATSLQKDLANVPRLPSAIEKSWSKVWNMVADISIKQFKEDNPNHPNPYAERWGRGRPSKEKLEKRAKAIQWDKDNPIMKRIRTKRRIETWIKP